MSKWAVVEETDNYISCDGIFTKYAYAVCKAYAGMSRRIEDMGGKAACSALYRLESDSGFGFHYEIEGYGKVRVYILEGEEADYD